MKLDTTNIRYIGGHCWKGFPGPGSKVKVMQWWPWEILWTAERDFNQKSHKYLE